MGMYSRAQEKYDKSGAGEEVEKAEEQPSEEGTGHLQELHAHMAEHHRHLAGHHERIADHHRKQAAFHEKKG